MSYGNDEELCYPERIGPYLLGKTLGVGATSRVKLGTHVRTGKHVAVKILNKRKLMFDHTMASKVEVEIAVTRLIYHPHVLRLFDVLETDSFLFMITEYVEGGELFDYLLKRGHLSTDEAAKFFRQIISGLAHCHRHRICHRDLKPENILLDGKGNVKLCDFGMASLMKSDDELLSASCGSPHYASPEIVAGQWYDGAAADIWSCGVILFALLAGRLPFDHPDMRRLLYCVRSATYSWPDDVNVDENAKDLVHRMLQVDPGSRATMEEIFAHPFTSSGCAIADLPVYTSALDVAVDAPLDLASLDEQILESLADLGWGTRADIVSQLVSPFSNHEKVFYHLYKERKELDRQHAMMAEDNGAAGAMALPSTDAVLGEAAAKLAAGTTPASGNDEDGEAMRESQSSVSSSLRNSATSTPRTPMQNDDEERDGDLDVRDDLDVGRDDASDANDDVATATDGDGSKANGSVSEGADAPELSAACRAAADAADGPVNANSSNGVAGTGGVDAEEGADVPVPVIMNLPDSNLHGNPWNPVLRSASSNCVLESTLTSHSPLLRPHKSRHRRSGSHSHLSQQPMIYPPSRSAPMSQLASPIGGAAGASSALTSVRDADGNVICGTDSATAMSPLALAGRSDVSPPHRADAARATTTPPTVASDGNDTDTNGNAPLALHMEEVQLPPPATVDGISDDAGSTWLSVAVPHNSDTEDLEARRIASPHPQASTSSPVSALHPDAPPTAPAPAAVPATSSSSPSQRGAADGAETAVPTATQPVRPPPTQQPQGSSASLLKRRFSKTWTQAPGTVTPRFHRWRGNVAESPAAPAAQRLKTPRASSWFAGLFSSASSSSSLRRRSSASSSRSLSHASSSSSPTSPTSPRAVAPSRKRRLGRHAFTLESKRSHPELVARVEQVFDEMNIGSWTMADERTFHARVVQGTSKMILSVTLAPSTVADDRHAVAVYTLGGDAQQRSLVIPLLQQLLSSH